MGSKEGASTEIACRYRKRLSSRAVRKTFRPSHEQSKRPGPERFIIATNGLQGAGYLQSARSDAGVSISERPITAITIMIQTAIVKTSAAILIFAGFISFAPA
jgi:hypothetical protein